MKIVNNHDCRPFQFERLGRGGFFCSRCKKYFINEHHPKCDCRCMNWNDAKKIQCAYIPGYAESTRCYEPSQLHSDGSLLDRFLDHWDSLVQTFTPEEAKAYSYAMPDKIKKLQNCVRDSISIIQNRDNLIFDVMWIIPRPPIDPRYQQMVTIFVGWHSQAERDAWKEGDRYWQYGKDMDVLIRRETK